MPICINMQVPLGIQLLSKNNLNDMGKILENFHKLVPTHDKEGHLTLPNGEMLDFDDTSFFTVLLGGDQLTVARARGRPCPIRLIFLRIILFFILKK